MHVFVTGTGSGIGKALAEALLKKGISVSGISRSNKITHPLYQHYSVDLASESERDAFHFPDLDAEEVVLINNSGTIGEIEPFFNLSADAVRNVLRLNTEALIELSLRFYKKYENKTLTLIHIGSGAAENPIKGWSLYCASKAAVHHFNKVLNEEISHYKKNIRSIVVSPGVVDTPMQKEIRSSNTDSFPDWGYFNSLKEQNTLASADLTAQKIIYIIENKALNSPLVSLRDLDLPN